MEIAAVIPAGGKGLRSGLKIPKQFTMINGVEMIAYTISVFQKNRDINKIVVAAPEKYFPLLERCRKKYKFSKLAPPVKGGNERQDSVFNALKAENFSDDDLILVHDAARPLLSQKLLSEIIKTALIKGNAVPAVKARDTLAIGEEIISSYPDRINTWYIQTPQAFRYSVLKNAFDEAFKTGFYGTDESMLVHRTGEKVFLVEGSFRNFKVTTREDLKILKKLI